MSEELTWEVDEEGEGWAAYRADDLSYSQFATADTEGFWTVGHTTWSRENGPEEHEDDSGSADGLDGAKAAALAKLAERREWVDEYERQMRECEEREAISEEELARIQDEEGFVVGDDQVFF